MSRGKVVNSETNEKIRIVGTNTDITQRELASIIYKNSSQGMFISDSNNKIISVNPSFNKITGYELEDVIGSNPKILSSKMHDDIFYKEMWSSIVTNNCWSGEIKNKRNNMRDNIFFLSDASYCDNSKTATIAVFNCFSKERFIKKLFDLVSNE